jgi:hypothetical protein
MSSSRVSLSFLCLKYLTDFRETWNECNVGGDHANLLPSNNNNNNKNIADARASKGVKKLTSLNTMS